MKPIFIRWATIAICFVAGFYIGKSQAVVVEVASPPKVFDKEERDGYMRLVKFLEDECACWQKNYDAVAADNDLLRTQKP